MSEFLARIEKMRVWLPPIDAGQLKYFAAFTMLIDHAACIFLERTFTPQGQPLAVLLPKGELLCRCLRAAGRQAFPIFCFFLVEGFFYTRSRLRYLATILAFGVLSQLPFQEGIFAKSSSLHANVMFTLALGLLAVWVIEAMGDVFLPEIDPGGTDGLPGGGGGSGSGENPAYARDAVTSLWISASQASAEKASAGRRGKSSVLARLLSAPSREDAPRDLLQRILFLVSGGGAVYGFAKLGIFIRTDYSYGGVLMIVLLYLLRDYRICALFFSWLWIRWYNNFETYAFPAFFLLACYNGKRGRQSKFFFYCFYPAHLAALCLLRRWIFGG